MNLANLILQLMSKPRSWLDPALAFAYPEVCQVCEAERATPEQGYVGDVCRRGIRLIQPPFCDRCGLPFEGDIGTDFECTNCRGLSFAFSRARSAVVARGVVLDLIHSYKYRRALWVEPLFAELLVAQARSSLNPDVWDMLVPVPLYPVKEREREFNQAWRLAVRLSRGTGIPVRQDLLRRVAPSQTQTKLSRAERAANVRRAFRLHGLPDLKGKRVVVVDDVFTTGSTTNACADKLIKAGAEEVCVWTLARGI